MLPSFNFLNPLTSLMEKTTEPDRYGGTDRDAIVFATEALEPFEGLIFLKDYLKDNLDSWPEYVDWLAERQLKGAA
ncbi:hypothetical protein LZK73_21735 [Neorhizobium galegae]|nr:hypothetical protein LZK73_21735 [Neorhizobium galegae]